MHSTGLSIDIFIFSYSVLFLFHGASHRVMTKFMHSLRNIPCQKHKMQSKYLGLQKRYECEPYGQKRTGEIEFRGLPDERSIVYENFAQH